MYATCECVSLVSVCHMWVCVTCECVSLVSVCHLWVCVTCECVSPVSECVTCECVWFCANSEIIFLTEWIFHSMYEFLYVCLCECVSVWCVCFCVCLCVHVPVSTFFSSPQDDSHWPDSPSVSPLPPSLCRSGVQQRQWTVAGRGERLQWMDPSRSWRRASVRVKGGEKGRERGSDHLKDLHAATSSMTHQLPSGDGLGTRGHHCSISGTVRHLPTCKFWCHHTHQSPQKVVGPKPNCYGHAVDLEDLICFDQPTWDTPNQQ